MILIQVLCCHKPHTPKLISQPGFNPIWNCSAPLTVSNSAQRLNLLLKNLCLFLPNVLKITCRILKQIALRSDETSLSNQSNTNECQTVLHPSWCKHLLALKAHVLKKYPVMTRLEPILRIDISSHAQHVPKTLAELSMTFKGNQGRLSITRGYHQLWERRHFLISEGLKIDCVSLRFSINRSVAKNQRNHVCHSKQRYVSQGAYENWKTVHVNGIRSR